MTVPDGGTIMIGGLKTSISVDKTSTLPFLRNIPGGPLMFGKQGEFTARQNLIILIKAHITSLAEEEPQLRLNPY